jgi:hypothetical protein
MSQLERRVEEYVNDLRCTVCREPIAANGCPCSRARNYQAVTETVWDWYESLPEHVKSGKRGIRPMAAVRSTLTRQRRVAGFRDMPTEPVTTFVGGAFGGATVAVDERLGLQREHDIKTKWVKPTEIRTARADREPI